MEINNFFKENYIAELQAELPKGMTVVFNEEQKKIEIVVEDGTNNSDGLMAYHKIINNKELNKKFENFISNEIIKIIDK